MHFEKDNCHESCRRKCVLDQNLVRSVGPGGTGDAAGPRLRERRREGHRRRGRQSDVSGTACDRRQRDVQSDSAGQEGSAVGKAAAGNVQSDGTFTLGTYSQADGAVVGRHRVSYAAPLPELPAGKELQPGESMPPSPYDGLVPREAEVEVKSGSNDIQIELVPQLLQLNHPQLNHPQHKRPRRVSVLSFGWMPPSGRPDQRGEKA